MTITEKYIKLKESIPNHVQIVLACKTRTKEELIEVIEAGATDFGQNYVQEAEKIYEELGEYKDKVKWHLIGSLQKNKINKILPIVSSIQTVDSLKLAEDIDKRAKIINKIVEVYIEINSGYEENKSGIMPDYKKIKELALKIKDYENLKLKGIMTMGKITDNKNEIKECFKLTKNIYDELNAEKISGIYLDTLSMGMTDSYEIAIEEGSNMIRVGSLVFGERVYRK